MGLRSLGRDAKAVAVPALLTLLACSHAPAPSTPAEYDLGLPTVFVSEASGMLAAPLDLAVDSAGTLYVLDGTDRHVVRLTPDGSAAGMIGQPGPGPGELTLPLSLGVDAADTVRVFDMGKGAVEVFSALGAYARQYRVPSSGITSHVVFGPDGRMANAGRLAMSVGALVAEFDRSGTQTGVLDTLVKPETTIPPDLLEQVHQKRLPDFMRNNALPVLTADGGAWLFLQTEGVLDHFTTRGVRDVRQTVHVPEMSTIAQAYFDWYSQVDARDALRYFVYVEDATATQGSLWLLWQTGVGQPALVTLHDGRGRLCARFLLHDSSEKDVGHEPDPTARPPLRRLAVDTRRSRIYISDYNTAAVWSFATPVTKPDEMRCSSG